MSQVTKQTEWLTVQFFLDKDGVSEVSVDSSDYSRARCTCPVAAKRRKCRHLAYVKDEVKRTGTYAITLPDDMTPEEVVELMGSPDDFRHMLAHLALVVVLED